MNPCYEKSKYVYCTELSGSDDVLLYSFRTRKFLRLTPLQKLIYDQAPFDSLESPFLQDLYDMGFLTDEDEYQLLLERRKRAASEDRGIHLLICPTMTCNFSCTYCIETGQLRKGEMTAQVQEGVVRFVQKLIAEAKAESMMVIWFGGEPMLKMDIIQSLSRQLIRLAEDHQISYRAGIYTNGYFLTEENIRILEAARVDTVRISLDGSRESHDRMRHLAGGQGSYDTILGNLRIPASFSYLIRCNMNRKNLDEYPVLVDHLKKIHEESGNQIYVKPERMRVEKDVSGALKDIELSYPEYYDYYQSVRHLTVCENERDYFSYLTGRDTGVVCNAVRRYSFCIDELGNLYKCNWFIGKADHVIGNVFDYEDYSSVLRAPDTEYFLGSYLSQREKCRNCVMLPSCGGRCPLSWEEEGKYDCNRFIDTLDRSLNESYRKYHEIKERNGKIYSE